MKTNRFRASAVALLAALLSLSVPVRAQNDPLPTFSRQFAIGLSAGLKSVVGIDASARLAPHFAARIGLNHARLEIDRRDVSLLGSKSRYDVRAFERLSNLEALGEWSPGRRGKFRLIAGAAYFFKNELGFSGALVSEASLNDAPLDPEEIGSGDVTVSWRSPVSGYAGLGFGRLIPQKRLGLSFEIGSWIKGRPRFDIDATELLSENDRNEPILDRNFKNKIWFPNLSIRLAYRLAAKLN